MKLLDYCNPNMSALLTQENLHVIYQLALDQSDYTLDELAAIIAPRGDPAARALAHYLDAEMGDEHPFIACGSLNKLVWAWGRAGHSYAFDFIDPKPGVLLFMIEDGTAAHTFVAPAAAAATTPLIEV